MMTTRGVLVVTETPSLGASVLELLESAGIRARQARGPAHDFQVEPEVEPGAYPVIIVACNEPHCETAKRWRNAEFPPTDLVVVGGRDVSLCSGGRLHVVRLPLVPSDFLTLVHRLLGSSPNAEGGPTIDEWPMHPTTPIHVATGDLRTHRSVTWA